MGQNFDQPPRGPELGPVKNFKDLSPEKREQLGDMEKLVSEPAPLDPRVLEAEKAAETPPEPLREPDESEETQKIQPDVTAELEALRAVLSQPDEVDDEPDPEELAMQAAAQPTDEDKQRFMRCLFGDTLYTKEYQLFGGMLIVEMTDRPALIDDRIFMQLSLDQKMGEIETQDDWDIMLDRYRMVSNIAKVMWSGNQIMEAATGSNLRELVKERIDEGIKNSVVYRALLRATRVFRLHLDVMLERAMDSDFWQVGGASSQSEAT